MKRWRRAALALLATAVAMTASAAGVTLPAYERVVLENGTVLLLGEKHDVPLLGPDVPACPTCLRT